MARSRVNNGAVAVPPHPVADLPEDDFDLVIQINLKGVFYAVSAAWPLSDRASYVTGVALPVTGGAAV
ncbi:hypothetical protein A5760_23955 [Mycobacterium colombiense]|uniref:Uncharacterized protein n=1 Tax=Mycobacterium colombiense TaxID=339268 RepID=A0A1A0VZ49_9MYCO|nr:SDR family oxidoreductase [Mycobacterium colombiense]OBB88502.1 hypothetical protein A5760_23955 [Mycobacterium colombiense]